MDTMNDSKLKENKIQENKTKEDSKLQKVVN